MNALDWSIIILVLISALIGVVRGIFKEILKLINLVLAGYTAVHLRKYCDPVFNFIKANEIREIIEIVLIFIFMFIGGSIITFLIGQMLNPQGFGKFIDKLLGVSYGVARGLLIVIIIITLLEKNPSIVKKNWWQQSWVLVEIKKLSNILYKVVPSDLKDQLDRL